jgi:uncharacterized paraquat-inducible protein A
MNEWIYCDSCNTEFSVETLEDSSISFCPFCGEPIDVEDEDDEDDYWSEDE